MNLLSLSEIKVIDKLYLRSKKDLLGYRQGQHKSKRRGQGLEFSEYKEYAPGDDFRSIDWNSAARTEKLYSRIYREEQEITSIILLDFSKSLILSSQGSFVKKLALALYYIAVRSGTRAVLVLPEVCVTQASSSPRSVNIIESLLNKSSATGTFNLTTSIKLCMARVKLPAKVFIISDFMFETNEAHDCLSLLKVKNYDSTVISIRSKPESMLGPIQDHETEEIIESEVRQEDIKALEKLTNLHYLELENICSKFQTSYFEVEENTKIEDFLFEKLVKSRVLY